MNRPFASSFAGGTHVGVPTDLQETTALIAALSAKDAATWGTLVAGFGAQVQWASALPAQMQGVVLGIRA